MAPELASPGLRGAVGCSAWVLLLALQGLAKAPSMNAGAAGPAPKTCQLKSRWCSNRDISPVPSLHLPWVIPVVGSP